MCLSPAVFFYLPLFFSLPLSSLVSSFLLAPTHVSRFSSYLQVRRLTRRTRKERKIVIPKAVCLFLAVFIPHLHFFSILSFFFLLLESSISFYLSLSMFQLSSRFLHDLTSILRSLFRFFCFPLLYLTGILQ